MSRPTAGPQGPGRARGADDDTPGGRPFPDRRDFVALGVGAFMVGVIPWARRRRPLLVRRTVPLMGTVGEISVVHSDRAYAQRAIDAALAELRRVETAMSRFRADSDVGRANRLALGDAVSVSPETGMVIREGLRFAGASGGAFDPCLGRASELWDVTGRTRPPAPEATARFARRELHRELELTGPAEAPRVRYHDPDVALDLGGIAKGYAVDRAADALRSYGVFDGFVNVGGDLYALGTSEDGEPWDVGIRSPWVPDRVLTSFRISDRGVATSGDYLRFFEHGGVRYHHLLDPATGIPRQSGVHSVTVAAPTTLMADASTTTVFGRAEAAAWRLLAAAAPEAELLHLV